MATSPTTGPALSHEELAALDFIIMRAIQRGAKPNEVLGFIDSIADIFTDAASAVADIATKAVNAITDHTDDIVHGLEAAADVAEAATHIAEAIGAAAARAPGPAVEAMRQAITSTAKTPTLTLQQLIAVRRAAVQAQSGK
jgi:hypothetical protein